MDLIWLFVKIQKNFKVLFGFHQASVSQGWTKKVLPKTKFLRDGYKEFLVNHTGAEATLG